MQEIVFYLAGGLAGGLAGFAVLKYMEYLALRQTRRWFEDVNRQINMRTEDDDGFRRIDAD